MGRLENNAKIQLLNVISKYMLYSQGQFHFYMYNKYISYSISFWFFFQFGIIARNRFNDSISNCRVFIFYYYFLDVKHYDSALTEPNESTS